MNNSKFPLRRAWAPLLLALPILALLAPTPAAAQPEVASANWTIRAAFAQLNACTRAIHENPEFGPLLPHLAGPAGFSMAQMADERLPTAWESRLWASLYAANNECFGNLIAELQPVRPDIAAVMANGRAAQSRIVAQLLARRITFGEYAREAARAGYETKTQMAAALSGKPVPTFPVNPRPSPPVTDVHIPHGHRRSQPIRTASSDPEAVPLVNNDGGALAVPVLINGQITLNFAIDSGASDVSVPADVVSTLMRTGTLQKSDFIGQAKFQLADGSTVPSEIFLIRSLKVGNYLLENVEGSVANAKGPLLLGRSFLTRFNSWSIDNKRQVLLLNSPSERLQSRPPADTPQASALK